LQNDKDIINETDKAKSFDNNDIESLLSESSWDDCGFHMCYTRPNEGTSAYRGEQAWLENKNKMKAR
jgi:hypothetical protein